ncbi:MAG TPA: VWA domain-containing protein [Pyrinomonadaceae bacterium]|nr:VWA domain-containing protein [Pyrinomonadaceae bacterium]
MSNRRLKSRFQSLPLLFFIFLCLAVSGFAQDDEEIVKVESSVVVLNATITDAKGKAVSQLNKSKFRIFEDGIEQKIEFFETAETPFAAVILLDTSGSMEQRVSLARSATINFLDGLRPDDSAAIYNFDSQVSLVQDFSNSRDVAPAVFDLKAEGVTVLNDAIFKAAQELSRRSEKRKAIIVLSDGADTRSKFTAGKALKAALAADTTIYTVDMSSADANNRERMQSRSALKNFAEKTGGLFVATPGGVAMREAFKNIVRELGTQYTLGYQPTNLKKDGKWRALELKVSQPNLTIRTRKGYNAQNK